MGQLDNFSIDELQQELLRRTAIQKTSKPQILSTERMLLQLAFVVEQCKNYIDRLDEDVAWDTSVLKHSIFESCMEMVFGNDVWDWVNSKKV